MINKTIKEAKILGRHIGKVTDKDIDIAKFKTKIAEARRDFQHAKKITAGKEINKKTAHDKAVDKRNNYLTGILMKQDYQRQVNSAKDILNKNKVKKEGN